MGIQFCLFGESGRGILSQWALGDGACLFGEGAYHWWGESGDDDLRTESHFLPATSDRLGILIQVFWWGV